MPVFDGYSIAAYMFGLFVIYICIWMFIKPLKWLFKIALNSLFGAALLTVINWIGGFAGISIGVNLITAAIVGILGVPGIILLFIIKFVVT